MMCLKISYTNFWRLIQTYVLRLKTQWSIHSSIQLEPSMNARDSYNIAIQPFPFLASLQLTISAYFGLR